VLIQKIIACDVVSTLQASGIIGVKDVAAAGMWGQGIFGKDHLQLLILLCFGKAANAVDTKAAQPEIPTKGRVLISRCHV